MKKVLVTGAGGFIGSHLVEALHAQGHDVRAFVHYNSNGQWGWLEDSSVKNDIEVFKGDVRDLDSVQLAMQNCDVVYHLAALIGIPYSYESPLAYVKTNVEGTYNILQAARTTDVSRVLVTSTSETYGTAQYVPIDEKHPASAQSPYAATKVAADQLALSFYRSFDLPVSIVRPFNTYGPRQSARAIIPTIITQILSGKRTLKLGNLSPTRDLTFVKDTAAGFISIAACDECLGKATNIGMSDEISIGDLVSKIADVMGVEVEIVEDEQRVRADKSEVERLFCCNSELKKHTDWEPSYGLGSGLEETIEWLKGHMDLYKAEIYSV